MMKKLDDIEKLLTTLVSLYKAVHIKIIEEIKDNLLKVETRRRVYELCDGTKTVSEIAQALDPSKPLKQSQALASYHLTTMERAGLLGHTDQKGQRFYFQILE
jgi:DNA-binding transcriptional ArsR family regulator